MAASRAVQRADWMADEKAVPWAALTAGQRAVVGLEQKAEAGGDGWESEVLK